jgi:hypothetical protein
MPNGPLRRPPIWNIDRRLLLKLLAAAGYSTSLSAHAAGRVASSTPYDARDLLERWHHPPSEANLGAYWYWLGGNVTAEGITADLEAMQAAGISQPMLYTIGKSDKNSPVSPPADALTEYWWQLVEHAAQESERLGLTLALNCCDGWGTAGGSWITPELSMQHVVWSELTVAGGQDLLADLPSAKGYDGYYRDIAILGMPFPEDWEQTSFNAGARLTTDLPLEVDDPQKITDPRNAEEITDTKEDGWILFAFPAPFTLRSVTVHTPSPEGYAPGVYRAANSLEVQASDDGVAFHTIGRLEYPKHGWQTDLTTLTHAVPQTTARYFRLLHHKIVPQPYEEEYDFSQDTRLRFFSILLSSEPRIHQWQGKTGEQWAISRKTTAADVPDGACIKTSELVELTKQLDSSGRLSWRVPAGRWRILRLGFTSTGSMNSAAGSAKGLECDRFNAEAVKLLFDNWFGEALSRVGPQRAGKVLHVVHVDSWEAGTQNWSPGFETQFSRLRGYDITQYLPVMAGIPMESAELSERVLFDVRRTISDLTRENFFKTVAELAHAKGCVFSAEPANPTYLCDGLEYAAYADLPMGEFWYNTPRNDKPTDIKDAVSGARVYGKPVAGGEAFTEGLIDWSETPPKYKALGDHNYCQGINFFMLHVYAQQPWLDRAPGITLNGIGNFFSRTQTWWKPGKTWFDYLRRCQALLQAGRSVSDICAFTGEDVPRRALLPRNLSFALPPGYAYDSINRDALLRLARVENGELVLQSGVRYGVLVLPNELAMTPQLAERLHQLVDAGATVVGPPPERSPSLEQRETADQQVRAIRAELWGDLDGTEHRERLVGRGRVVWGKSVPDVLGEIGLPPDLEIRSEAGEALANDDVQWTHRRGDGWDSYFLSNQSGKPLRIEALFRIKGKIPELWRAESGAREVLALWRPQGGRTAVPISLDVAQSVFVVFAQPAHKADPVVAVESAHPDAIRLLSVDGSVEALLDRPGRWRLRHGSGRVQMVELRRPLNGMELRGPWNVRFADRLASPVVVRLHELVSWTDLPQVKYYSGTAVYQTRFTLARRRGHRLLLELGAVHDLAEIRLNGRRVTTLWTPPFVIDVTEWTRQGANRLEIEVTNTWHNRLVGDDGKSDRTSYVVPMLRKDKPWLPGADTPLLPAGLLGPVRLRPVAQRRL